MFENYVGISHHLNVNSISKECDVRVHSTSLGHRDNNQSIVVQDPSTEDPVERFARALENKLNTIRQTSLCNDNSRFVHRMTSGKKLPTFSDNPLEWPRFKKEFELSTILGDYTDSENVSRLWDTLIKDARETTRSLFVAGNNSSEIIKNLETDLKTHIW